MFGQTASAQIAAAPRSPLKTSAAAAAISATGSRSEIIENAPPMRSAATSVPSVAAARALALNGAISRPATISAMPDQDRGGDEFA